MSMIILAVAVAGAGGVGLLFGPGISLTNATIGAGMLSASIAAVSAVAAGLLMLRWQISGEARSGALGLGVVVLFVAHPLLSTVVRSLIGSHQLPGGLDVALVLAGMILLLVDYGRPPIDTGWSLSSRLLLVAVSTAIAGTALELWSPPRIHWTGAIYPEPTTVTAPAWPYLVLALVVTLLAGLLIRRGRLSGTGADQPMGVALLGWAAAITLVAVFGHQPTTVVAADAVRAIGSILLLAGVIRAFARDYANQQSRLLDARVSELAVEARDRAAEEALRSRAHDARSVFLAVQTAASALQAGRAVALDDGQRSALADVLRQGLDQLDVIVRSKPDIESPYCLVDAGRALRRWARDAGIDVTVRIPPEVEVVGYRDRTVEAIRSLVAHMGAAGAHVVVVGLVDGPWGQIRVSATELDRSIFPPLDDLSALVAGELIKSQGGQLESVPGPDGWHSFVVWLPLRMSEQRAPTDHMDTSSTAQSTV